MNFNDTEGIYTYTFEAEKKVGWKSFSLLLKFLELLFQVLFFSEKECYLDKWLRWVLLCFSQQFFRQNIIFIWAVTCDFQQCGILTCVDSDKPVQPPFKLRNSKWCSVSSFTVIEYLSNKRRLWSVCAYAQAGLSLCWLHIPHCWKSHFTAQIFI